MVTARRVPCPNWTNPCWTCPTPRLTASVPAANGVATEAEASETSSRLGQSGAAKPHFARAATLLGGDAWFVANEVARLERLRMLAG